MLLRDPCKQCIVRACCTITCADKRDQINTIEMYFMKSVVTNIYSWIKEDKFEVIFTSLFVSLAIAEICFLVWVVS